jgi:hypothetical protein
MMTTKTTLRRLQGLEACVNNKAPVLNIRVVYVSPARTEETTGELQRAVPQKTGEGER